MGCHGESCDVNSNQVRVKRVSTMQRVNVDLWLKEFVAEAERKGDRELAERVRREELKP